MNRTTLSMLTLSAALLLATGVKAGENAGQPYCPPGAKFCPAPGTDNTVFLDTHFGMDAQTGQVTAYKGTVHPDDVANPPMTGEKVLYVAPPISVENRYVPYPGAPETNMMASTQALSQPIPTPYAGMDQIARPQSPPSPSYQPQPQSFQPQTYQSYQQPYQTPSPELAYSSTTQRHAPDARSEVAHKQTDRQTGQREIQQDRPWWKGGLWANRNNEPTEGERVPWWKGGLWRNKGSKDADGDNGGDASQTASARGKSGTSREDDMWDNDEFTGYNPDSSGGQPNMNQQSDPFAAPVFTDATQQSQFYDPYTQSAPPGATGGPMYAGDAYTLPDSPPPSTPYQPGYVYPGTAYSADTYTQPSSPYATASAPVSPNEPLMLASQTAPQSGSFLPPPPGTASPVSGPPAMDAGGSMQFENAVRLVKDGRFSDAKAILNEETRSNPSHAASWRWLGDCYYNLLELDGAITSYQRALDLDPNDYYALRGQGFAYLHRGHEYWRRMQEEVAMGNKEQAAATFAQAHDNYKKSLELLGFCLRRAPNDSEAIYGEAMAAEGASRKLYSNAISYLKLGPENRERAELFAENCLTVINKGIDRAKERAKLNPGESGPRALLGGLYLRKAILYRQLEKNDLALMELRNARDVQQSILDEIDKNNTTAQKGIRECETYWEQWGGNREQQQARF